MRNNTNTAMTTISNTVVSDAMKPLAFFGQRDAREFIKANVAVGSAGIVLMGGMPAMFHYERDSLTIVNIPAYDTIEKAISASIASSHIEGVNTQGETFVHYLTVAGRPVVLEVTDDVARLGVAPLNFLN